MISVKGGTQTWSSTPQPADRRSEGLQNISATDKKKVMGDGQDIGDVLNKVADPNYIEPGKKLRAVGNAALDKDAFMKLLLTQMKNQDPTSPLKSHEMSAQLAQFTSLEKLTNIDSSIEGLRKDQAPMQNFESLNLIGKSVAGDSARINRADAKENHSVRFNLGADAINTKVEIKDAASGKVVRTIEFKNLKRGKNDVSWNGQLDDGTMARPGEYLVQVDARGSNGAKVSAQTKFDGIIDGITFTPKGPMLMIGNQQVLLSDVEKISTPRAETAPVPTAEVNPKVNGVTVKPEDKPNAQNIPSGMGEIAMSREIMNKLAKEGAL